MSPVHGLPTNFLVITDHFVINDLSPQGPGGGERKYAIDSGIVAVSLLKINTYFPTQMQDRKNNPTLKKSDEKPSSSRTVTVEQLVTNIYFCEL
jgi:hypothetical protein